MVENRNSSKNLVSKLTYSGKLSDTWSYTYDSNGRIASESHGSTNTYGYDGQGQLTSAKVNGTQYSYTYDTAGNITGKTIGSTSYNYEYNNPKWLDQLTGYNGGTITYDNCGNPLTYYDGSSFTWTQGRRLSGYTKGSTSIEFAYNMAGVRSSKTVGNTTYNYTTLSGLVTRQTWGSNSIDFLYDENNQPFAMKYNGTWYYYVLNVQGDVVKLIKADGTVAASYTYDPWGKVLTSTGDLANINPLRYRGYYYDAETGLYYLQSRYYDPEIGRFINADAYATTDVVGILSANMYAYCENDPVNRSDPTGEIAPVLVAMAGGAAFGLLEQFMTDLLYAMVSGKPLEQCFSSIGTYAAAAVGGALSAFPGGGAMKICADVILTSTVQTCVDAVFSPREYENSSPYRAAMENAATAGASGYGENNSYNIASRLTETADSATRNAAEPVKRVVNKIARGVGDVIKSVGRYFGNALSILFRLGDDARQSKRAR